MYANELSFPSPRSGTTPDRRPAQTARPFRRIIQRLAVTVPKGFLLAMLTCSSQIAVADELVDKALAASARGDTTEALKIWEQLGNAGDAGAMVEAGVIYQVEIKTESAYEKALDWYLKSESANGPSVLVAKASTWRSNDGLLACLAASA